MTTEEMQKQIESMMSTPQQIVEHIDKKLEEKREQKYKDACCVIDEIISEFSESEDEKIRKALIRFHKSTIDVDGIKGEDILAWLEKQGEQQAILDELEMTLSVSEDAYLRSNLEKLIKVLKKGE